MLGWGSQIYKYLSATKRPAPLSNSALSLVGRQRLIAASQSVSKMPSSMRPRVGVVDDVLQPGQASSLQGRHLGERHGIHSVNRIITRRKPPKMQMLRSAQVKRGNKNGGKLCRRKHAEGGEHKLCVDKNRACSVFWLADTTALFEARPMWRANKGTSMGRPFGWRLCISSDTYCNSSSHMRASEPMGSKCQLMFRCQS